MIPLLCRDALRALDRDAESRLGLPTALLMENAGRGAFEVLCSAFPGALARVVVIGGIGQNGGDGWVVARHLLALGKLPRAVLIGERARVRGDAALNLQALERLGIDPTCVTRIDELDLLVRELAGATLVVDALFGTGLDRPLSELHAAVVERINACAASIVALDLPSGVDADTGAVLGIAVRAQMTVTFAAHKRGLHQYPGVALAGDVRCTSIGLPAPVDADATSIEHSDIARWIEPRAADAHKGQAGGVLVIGGSPGRTGAALLSGLGALRAGAGLVTLAPRGEARAALDAKVVEMMTRELPADLGHGVVSGLGVDVDGVQRSVVVGPGLGVDHEGRAMALAVVEKLRVPVVVDADALTAIGVDHAPLHAAQGPRVLTPHPGEAARLLGVSSADVQRDRYRAAHELAQRTRSVVVLKGARTIIAEPSGRMRVCPRGTPAMAVAGSGDVLTGVIAALLANAEAFDAASAAVYLHALAGELAAHADRGLLASDLAAALPRAWAQCALSRPDA